MVAMVYRYLRRHWGLPISVLAGAAAVYFSQHHQQVTIKHRDEETFCYEGVVTDASEPTKPTTCFTVAEGKFTRVFPHDGQQVATKRGWAYPGLWDGHGHLLAYGEFLNSVDLFGSDSPEEVRRRIHGYLKTHATAGSRDEWIRGVGWDQMASGFGGIYPTAGMLEDDTLLRGLYVMLDRVDVHCTWVSQAVLDLLHEGMPDVPGGEVVRDPGMGVFCDRAMDLVLPLWPRPNKDKKRQFLQSAFTELHKVGLVGMHDAGVFPDDMALFTEMSQTEEWKLRVYAMVECEKRNTFCPDTVRKVYVEGDNGLLSVRSVKLFADGALGSWGSAMIEPYDDRPDTSGSLLGNGSTLASLTESWSRENYQVNIHAIGDLANRLSIDAMQATLEHVCGPGESRRDCQALRRFRIEHAQIIHADDQKRMHELGLIPSMQPTHATSDSKYATQRLGQERTSSEAYRMKSLVALQPVLGTDFPVEPPNPFEGIYAAVTRKSPCTGFGPPGAEHGWHVEEALTVQEALEGFTKGPARGAFLEGKAGIIKQGAFADWIVLDRRLEETDTEHLRLIRVRETWIAGRQVYSRDAEQLAQATPCRPQ